MLLVTFVSRFSPPHQNTSYDEDDEEEEHKGKKKNVFDDDVNEDAMLDFRARGWSMHLESMEQEDSILSSQHTGAH